MSIDTVGFSVWETLPANTMVRLTIAAHDNYEWFSFPVGAQKLFDSLLPVAGIIPTSRLNIVSSDQTAVIDANVKHEGTGAELLNKLETLASWSAFVSKVEKLSPAQKKESTTAAGASARGGAQLEAEQQKKDDSLLGRMGEYFDKATTVVKWAAILAGVVGVAYVAHEFRGARK